MIELKPATSNSETIHEVCFFVQKKHTTDDLIEAVSMLEKYADCTQAEFFTTDLMADNRYILKVCFIERETPWESFKDELVDMPVMGWFFIKDQMEQKE